MSGVEAREWWGGRLLVATPLIDEPIFRRTVVALLHHDPEGAVGVVINRPSPLPVGEPFPEWSDLAADPPVVFTGGPVADSAVVCLARPLTGEIPPGWTGVLSGVGALDLRHEPAEIRSSVQAVRLFAGYAGWGADQLEGEVEEGAWLVVDADPADALTDEPEALWRAVLRRQRGRERLMAWFPPDPLLQ